MSEIRLIDANALIENHFSDEHKIALSYANKLWMQRIINGEPTIDAVEVVRCKDCVHYYQDDDGWYMCDFDHGLDKPDARDFCSYGERKAGD